MYFFHFPLHVISILGVCHLLYLILSVRAHFSIFCLFIGV